MNRGVAFSGVAAWVVASALTFGSGDAVAETKNDDRWHGATPLWFPVWDVHPDYPIAPGNADVGAWCGGVAPDGTWAFSYGYLSAPYHCERVRRWIVGSQGAVAVPTNAGFFAIERWNRVIVNCDGWRWVQSGWGWPTLEAAFRQAQGSGSRFCRFSIGHW